MAHVNVTANPTAEWTLQQLREAIAEDRYRHLIHDRDRIYSRQLDESIEALGLEVLRSPIASPKANAICERVIGTIRRECLDWMIPISQMHLQATLREWVIHYNRGRPHTALGPGMPDPLDGTVVFAKSKSRHRVGEGLLVRVIGAGRPSSRVLARGRVILRQERKCEIGNARVIADDKVSARLLRRRV